VRVCRGGGEIVSRGKKGERGCMCLNVSVRGVRERKGIRGCFGGICVY